MAEGEGLAILDTTGIYPILHRSFTRGEELGEGGEVVSEAGRVEQFVRMTDNYVLEAPQPSNNGTDIPYSTIIEFKYRGLRPLGDYLSLFFGPLLAMLSTPVLVIVIAIALGYTAGLLADSLFSPAEKPRKASQQSATWLLIATPALMFILVAGVGDILPLTDPRRWGGLLLTMMLTVVGIIGSFPIGVLLALGRRSSLPVVKLVCTLYIELVRGVPFISVLFMGALLLPLTNPALSEVPGAYRAMIATIIFSAAYLAENVRGGLQSIPPGQEEAAKAIGLNGLQTIMFITLPQALRAVIPALVGMFIGLFKDTSLVAIVGLIDLTGITNAVVAQTEFLGDRREAFLFISIIYFVFSYVMSYVSRRIEASGAGAAMAKRI
ncbi:MAG: amino acid ABC transporter permease [Anaerolineaceae bacterium]|nr:amino acid ABC transporter permease [Anaerolineaceae bacterium]